MAFSGLITVFALGYALNAGYTALMFRYGAIAASLSIAGILLLTAAIFLVAALIVRRWPTAPPALSNLQFARLHAARRTGSPVLALGAGLAGAATVAAAIIGFRKRARSNELDT